MRVGLILDELIMMSKQFIGFDGHVKHERALVVVKFFIGFVVPFDTVLAEKSAAIIYGAVKDDIFDFDGVRE